MNIRTKTRRIWILVGGLAIVTALGFAGYRFALHRSHVRWAQERQRGLDQYQSRKYASAATALEQYLNDSNSSDDAHFPSALLAYADCLLHVAGRGAAPEVYKAKDALERYLQFQPADSAAQATLLDVYLRLSFFAKGAALANKLLEHAPNDIPALRALMRSSDKLHRPDEALAAANRIDSALGFDIEAEEATQRLLYQQGATAQALIDRTRALAKQHPGDPRFKWLVGDTLLQASRGEIRDSNATEGPATTAVSRPSESLEQTGQWRAQAIAELRAAAAAPPADAAFALALADSLKQALQFDAMFSTLRAGVAAAPSTSDDPSAVTAPDLLVLLANQLWYQSNRRGVEEALKSVSDLPASPKSSYLLGLWALAHWTPSAQVAADHQYTALLATLKQRASHDDKVAGAWAAALPALLQTELSESEQFRALQSAVALDSGNGICQFLLGELYDRYGESQLAFDAWVAALRDDRYWELPQLRVAQTLFAANRIGDCAQASGNALALNPSDPEAVSLALEIQRAMLNDPALSPADRTAQLKRVVQQTKQWQERNYAGAIGAEIELELQFSHADMAAKTMEAALASTPVLPPRTLVRLAEIDAAGKLGFDRRICDLVQTHFGLDPARALALAGDLARMKRTGDGLKLLEQAQDQSAQEHGQPTTRPREDFDDDLTRTLADSRAADALHWQLAIAQYQQAIGAASEPSRWAQFGRANPNSLLTQSLILRMPSALEDQEAFSKAIDRYSKMAGADAQLGKVAQASLLVQGHPAVANARQAIDLLTPIAAKATVWTVPHALLAQALLDSGKPRDAIAQLQLAEKTRPNDVDLQLRTASAQAMIGQNDQAQATYDRLSDDPGLDARGRWQLIAYFDQHGQTQRAADEVRKLGISDGVDAHRDATLAALDARIDGKIPEADALFRKVLANRTAQPSDLTQGLLFFARRGDLATARAFSDRLQEMADSPEAAAQVAIRFNEELGAFADAERNLLEQTQIHPQSADAWTELVGFYLRRLRTSDAVSAANRGLAVLPDGEALEPLKQRAVELSRIPDRPKLSILADTLSVYPDDPAAVKMLQKLQSLEAGATLGHALDSAAFDQLSQLADQYPRSAAIQEQFAVLLMGYGRFEKAAAVASRAVVAFPYQSEPARLAVMANAALHQWDAALDAARQWRQRSLANPLAADLAIAEALLKKAPSSPDLAVQQLQPHMSAARPTPANFNLYCIYCDALIRSGKSDQAAALLMPLLSQPTTHPTTASSAGAATPSHDWRMAWLRLAGSADSADAAGRWIDRVQPLLTTAENEQFALASAWQRVGAKYHSKDALETAAKVIQPLLASPKGSIAVWFLAARNARLLGHDDQAIQIYRKLTGEIPAADAELLADAQDNLAYLLLQHAAPGDLNEALELARKAIALKPHESTIYDTLARVEMKLGQTDNALRDFQTALEIDFNNSEARVGLADLYYRTSHADKARRQLALISGDSAGGATLPESVQMELSDLQKSLGAP